VTSPVSGASNAADLPDYAPVPRSSLGPARTSLPAPPTSGEPRRPDRRLHRHAPRAPGGGTPGRPRARGRAPGPAPSHLRPARRAGRCCEPAPEAHRQRRPALAVEREADEAAAIDVGDRRLAARALARAGLAKRGSPARHEPAPGVALAVADGYVALRARALLSPAPRPRRFLAGGLVLLAVLTLVGTVAAAQRTDDSLDRAEHTRVATVFR
jgi:hypothetical protein